MPLVNNLFTAERLAGYATQLVSLGWCNLSRLAVLVVGWTIVGWASRLVAVAIERLDVSSRSFRTNLFIIAIKILLTNSLLDIVGLQTTSSWLFWGRRVWPRVWPCKARWPTLWAGCSFWRLSHP